jgi:hypothetical protein
MANGESNPMSTRGCMEKQSVVDTSNEIIFSLKNKGNPGIYRKTDASLGHYM